MANVSYGNDKSVPTQLVDALFTITDLLYANGSCSDSRDRS